MRAPTAVYRLYDAEGGLVYVGASDSLGTRWHNHRRRSWWPRVTSYKLSWHEHRIDALLEEANAICNENPQENRALINHDKPWTLEELMEAPRVPSYPKPESAGRRARGEGALFQRRRDGIWIGSVDDGYTDDGRRRRRTFSSKDRETTERKLRDFMDNRGA